MGWWSAHLETARAGGVAGLGKSLFNYFIGKRKRKGIFSHFGRMLHDRPLQSVKLHTGLSQP
jgi:hypothetical protein